MRRAISLTDPVTGIERVVQDARPAKDRLYLAPGHEAASNDERGKDGHDIFDAKFTAASHAREG